MNKNIDRCIKYYRAGSDKRWVACLAASRVVGGYDRNATSHLAYALSLSISQVENLAKAGKAYRALRRFGVDSEVRKALTPSHFAAMWDLKHKLRFDDHEAAAQLRTAAIESVSVAQMAGLITGEYSEGEPQYLKWADKMFDAAKKMVESVDVPEHVQRAGYHYMQAYTEWRNEPKDA